MRSQTTSNNSEGNEAGGDDTSHQDSDGEDEDTMEADNTIKIHNPKALSPLHARPRYHPPPISRSKTASNIFIPRHHKFAGSNALPVPADTLTDLKNGLQINILISQVLHWSTIASDPGPRLLTLGLKVNYLAQQELSWVPRATNKPKSKFLAKIRSWQRTKPEMIEHIHRSEYT